jgi:GDPmannose 4,6-dehydratase
VRGETFVTRKITRSVAQTHHGLKTKLYLGNLDAERDWGHAKDYIYGMWLMMQHSEPDDFVLSTNRKISVRKFVELSYKEIGIDIFWNGFGVDEKGYNRETGDVLVEIDKEYFRPAEVDLLIGDYSKAKSLLGWSPRYTVEEIIKEMVSEDIKLFEKDKYLQDGGYEILDRSE